MKYHRRLGVAATALLLATPVAVWWVVGDLDERGADDRDRMFRPFELPSAVEDLAGGVAVLTVTVAAMVIGLAWYRRQVPRWAPVDHHGCARPAPPSAPTSVVGWCWPSAFRSPPCSSSRRR